MENSVKSTSFAGAVLTCLGEACLNRSARLKQITAKRAKSAKKKIKS